MPELPWYSKLREAHRPDSIRVLLIGESAPDPGKKERRFFYAPTLDRRDNLFRGVVDAFFGSSPGHAGDAKGPWLERLKAEGVFLIDLVPFPVDKLESGKAAERRKHVPACVEQARALDPSGIIVCHTGCFKVLAAPLKAAGLPLLHEESIPFPLGNHRARFVAEVRKSLARLDSVETD